jgi:L-rhamnose-H+ transport protein
MQPNPFLGVLFHSIGAFSSASCYTPQKQTKLWAWEVYWLMTATSAWLVLPIMIALLTIPNCVEVLRSCESVYLWRSFALGVIYGFGGLMFGLGIRYIGFSLNYAIAIGFSAALGTIAPLMWHPNKGFNRNFVSEHFSDPPGLIVLAGIVAAVAGIAVCGYAGWLRERSGGDTPSRYSFKIGVPLAVMAGILSAVFNYALLAGEPIEQAAMDGGANKLLKMNAIYPLSNGGAYVVSFIWCVFQIFRNKRTGQLTGLPGKKARTLAFYYVMAILSGAFWYFQFFFYGMGHWHMGERYGFTSWVLHMSMLILFSNFYGWLFKEWEGVRKRPRRVLHVGMAVIVVATLIIAYGNWRGEEAEAEFHVANTGKNENPGTAAKPFVTLERARDAIRESGLAGKTT